MKIKSVAIFGWIALALNTLILAFYGFMLSAHAFDSGLPNPFRQPLPVRIELICTYLSVAGMIATYWKQAWGGLCVSLCWIVFIATEWHVNGNGSVMLFWFMFSVGVCNMLAGLWRAIIKTDNTN